MSVRLCESVIVNDRGDTIALQRVSMDRYAPTRWRAIVSNSCERLIHSSLSESSGSSVQQQHYAALCIGSSSSISGMSSSRCGASSIASGSVVN